MFAPMRSTSSLLSTANGSAGAMSLLPNDWGRLLFLLDIIIVIRGCGCGGVLVLCWPFLLAVTFYHGPCPHLCANSINFANPRKILTNWAATS